MRRLCLPLLLFTSLATPQEKPNPSLEPLGFLVGEWQAKYNRKGVNGSDEAIAARVKTNWRLQGQLLEIEETQTVNGKLPSSTLLFITFDPEDKVYTGIAINSAYPSIPMTLRGTMKEAKLTLGMDSPGMASGSFVYEKLEGGKYRSSSTIKAGDQEFTESAEYSKAVK